MSGYRLDAGGRIDRTRRLSFAFDGQAYRGHPGDTLASALTASGVMLLGRSFKYHRPRGLLTDGPAEPNALVELRCGARLEPNTRATTVELFEGLEARSQNAWPSRDWDVGAVNGLLSPLLPAGFYYKTFMWPAAFWERVYEPLIRRAAGLGRATQAADPDTYEKGTLHADLLIVGAGPAGLMAALAAARAGLRTILADDQAEAGGRLLSRRAPLGEEDPIQWRDRVLAELGASPNVRVLPRTTVFGWYDGNVFGALERTADHLPEPPAHLPRLTYWRLHAKRALLCAGAEERPLVFGGNDRPGVMLASAGQALATRYGVAPGRRVAVFGNGDSVYEVARDLEAAGVELAALIDSRPDGAHPHGLETTVRHHTVVTATKGGRALKGIEILDRAHGRSLSLECDALLMSGGWNPILHLTCHRGTKPVWRDELAAFVPGELGEAFRVAGSAAGHMTTAGCFASALEAVRGVGADLGRDVPNVEPPACPEEPSAVTPLWRVAESKGKAFVDFQNDVTTKDIPLAAAEGYGSVELMKRYTTLGMATDQGKTSGVNGLAILAEVTGKPIPEVGTTTYRPTYVPVALGALAGPHVGPEFRPVRRSPLHRWMLRQGAEMIEAGAWMRPSHYPRGDEDWLRAMCREVTAVRSRVGLCDVSTLGKIDVQGPDAAELLNRVYINGWKTLPVGKARYGLMLREDGLVFDDGTTSRLGETGYLMTTTTANAAAVMAHLEFCLQALWPELDVQVASVTDQWGQIALAGPKSREVLARLVDGLDVSNDAFPFLAAAETTVLGGIPARVFRISFSGELAYEVAVPADYAEELADAMLRYGAEFGIVPYGGEALSTMRIEKGHPAGGELDGRTTAQDLGMGRMLSTKKDYIGRAMCRRPAFEEPDRPVLVGIRPAPQGAKLRAGAHLLNPGEAPSVEGDQGWVSSSCYSPVVGSYIGLAFLKRGRARIGEEVTIFDPLREGLYRGLVCDPVFVDPEHERLHA
jgi:sarcosine oxidase subunit alpha